LCLLFFGAGDLKDEEKVLAWLTSQDVFEIKDEIEEVNKKMLEKLLDENDFVAVFFCEYRTMFLKINTDAPCSFQIIFG
jgi:hypothetical protein